MEGDCDMDCFFRASREVVLCVSEGGRGGERGEDVVHRGDGFFPVFSGDGVCVLFFSGLSLALAAAGGGVAAPTAPSKEREVRSGSNLREGDEREEE